MVGWKVLGGLALPWLVAVVWTSHDKLCYCMTSCIICHNWLWLIVWLGCTTINMALAKPGHQSTNIFQGDHTSDSVLKMPPKPAKTHRGTGTVKDVWPWYTVSKLPISHILGTLPWNFTLPDSMNVAWSSYKIYMTGPRPPKHLSIAQPSWACDHVWLWLTPTPCLWMTFTEDRGKYCIDPGQKPTFLGLICQGWTLQWQVRINKQN